MIVAHDPVDLPRIALLPPQHHKLKVAAVVLAVFLVAKAVYSDLHRAKILN
jgi:hypothetical protein